MLACLDPREEAEFFAAPLGIVVVDEAGASHTNSVDLTIGVAVAELFFPGAV